MEKWLESLPVIGNIGVVKISYILNLKSSLRLKSTVRKKLGQRKRRIIQRLLNLSIPDTWPIYDDGRQHLLQTADRVSGLVPGNHGAVKVLARSTGWFRDINARLHRVKRHPPYHDSDQLAHIA